MKPTRSLTHYLRLGAILIGICLASQTAMTDTVKTQPGLTVTLHVYNSAHANSETVIRAEREVKRIYRQIGVETVWVEYAVPEDQHWTVRQASELYVNIVAQAPEDLVRLNALGVAPRAGHNRKRLYVYYDRVEDLYRKQLAATVRGHSYRWARTDQILGYVLAHEIGHLLGLEGHSEAGIMRAAWSRDDLLKLSCGVLAFTAQQAAVIRAEVAMHQLQN